MIILKLGLKALNGTRLEPDVRMASQQIELKVFGFPLPTWMRDSLQAFGMVNFLRVVFRYTFAGEYFERLYREAAGQDPIEERTVLQPVIASAVADQNISTTP